MRRSERRIRGPRTVIHLCLQIFDIKHLLRSQSHFNTLDVLQSPFEVMLESDSLVDDPKACRA